MRAVSECAGHAAAARLDRLHRQPRDELQHPLDIAHVLEPECLKAAAEVSAERKLTEPIPKLRTLVVASAFDAALHDAFGKVHRRNVYDTYGPDLMTHDVSRYLGPEFRGERLDRSLLSKRREHIPVFHSVGGLDPLESGDVETPVGDGLPETLSEWIRRDGLVRIKIKLQGDMTKAMALQTGGPSDPDFTAKIQAIKKMACGFRNRENFKTAIYFHCGGLDLYPRAENV